MIGRVSFDEKFRSIFKMEFLEDIYQESGGITTISKSSIEESSKLDEALSSRVRTEVTNKFASYDTSQCVTGVKGGKGGVKV